MIIILYLESFSICSHTVILNAYYLSNHMNVLIDASSRILYASYYIQGLYEVFGKKNVSFSSRYFKDLKRDSIEYSFEHYFTFVLIDAEKNLKKIVIDFCDPPDINSTAYKWCDAYAKINLNYSETKDEFRKKLILIPPGFGINIWNKRQTVYHCIMNLVKCKFSPIVGFKRFFQDYYVHYKRPSLSDYKNTSLKNNATQKPYVFMIATLWGSNGAHTNRKRKAFIGLVKSQECAFEGGFFIKEATKENEAYLPFSFKESYSSAQYLEKTKQSIFVFNTPAVHNCHGWKLAEYLAMGKAIISTPLSNEIPEKLQHTENIHIVSNDAELELAVTSLINDSSYRKTLGKNARLYFEAFVRPTAVIHTILTQILDKN